MNPNEVFDECKKRVRFADGTGNAEDLRLECNRLKALDQLRRLRKKSNACTISTGIKAQCKIWAVIVGINHYADLESLRGCVSDALSMQHYLMTHLGVDESRITLLLNEEATRRTILEAIWAYIDKCEFDDHLILYFSGRGTTYEPHELVDCHSRAICPSDRGQVTGTEVIRDITEHEALSALSNIRYVHEGQITVILDCSFIGAPPGEPDGPPPYGSYSCRYATPLARVQVPIDASAAKMIKKGISILDWTSTVVMAACKGNEAAHEQWCRQRNEYHGFFTEALIGILGMWHASSSISCEALIRQISCYLRDVCMSEQTPVASGIRKNYKLWN